jgi:hypothetical protein
MNNAKIVLWPLFHYILWDEATDGRIEKKSWDDYVFVNQQFADAILEQYQTGDIGNILAVLVMTVVVSDQFHWFGTFFFFICIYCVCYHLSSFMINNKKKCSFPYSNIFCSSLL